MSMVANEWRCPRCNSRLLHPGWCLVHGTPHTVEPVHPIGVAVEETRRGNSPRTRCPECGQRVRSLERHSLRCEGVEK